MVLLAGLEFSFAQANICNERVTIFWTFIFASYITDFLRQSPLSGQSVLFLQLHGGDTSGVGRAPECTHLLWADIIDPMLGTYFNVPSVANFVELVVFRKLLIKLIVKNAFQHCFFYFH